MERYCALANTHVYEVSTPCVNDHQFNEINLKQLETFASLLANSLDTFLLSTHRKAGHVMHSELSRNGIDPATND